MSSGYITSFLLAHRHELESVSLTDDELVVVVKSTLNLREAMVLFADLITYVTPQAARIYPTTPRKITLEL